MHHNHHDLPIFPNLAKDMLPDAPNQLWVADLTYVAIQAGFVYVAVILDAWSRKVVGYAIARSIDVRLTLAALRSAIDKRRPPLGSSRPATGGRPGENKRTRPERSERRFRMFIATPVKCCDDHLNPPCTPRSE